MFFLNSRFSGNPTRSLFSYMRTPTTSRATAVRRGHLARVEPSDTDFPVFRAFLVIIPSQGYPFMIFKAVRIQRHKPCIHGTVPEFFRSYCGQYIQGKHGASKKETLSGCSHDNAFRVRLHEPYARLSKQQTAPKGGLRAASAAVYFLDAIMSAATFDGTTS